MKTANLAMKIARASSLAKSENVRLESNKPVVDSYKTAYREDPFEVPIEEKLGLLLEITDRLMGMAAKDKVDAFHIYSW